jgi:hypothetical protein
MLDAKVGVNSYFCNKSFSLKLCKSILYALIWEIGKRLARMDNFEMSNCLTNIAQNMSSNSRMFAEDSKISGKA